jgi:saccharopine dehydrogenase-like NADP-dependent oxidoreductase
VIAADLAAACPQAKFPSPTCKPVLPQLPNLSWLEADLGDANVVVRLLASHDLAVGAARAPRLPGDARRDEAKRPMVDVSFSEEDPMDLDSGCAKAGIALVPDAGLAPGLALLVGRAVKRYGRPKGSHDSGRRRRDRMRLGPTATWSRGRSGISSPSTRGRRGSCAMASRSACRR